MSNIFVRIKYFQSQQPAEPINSGPASRESWVKNKSNCKTDVDYKKVLYNKHNLQIICWFIFLACPCKWWSSEGNFILHVINDQTFSLFRCGKRPNRRIPDSGWNWAGLSLTWRLLDTNWRMLQNRQDKLLYILLSYNENCTISGYQKQCCDWFRKKRKANCCEKLAEMEEELKVNN